MSLVGTKNWGGGRAYTHVQVVVVRGAAEGFGRAGRDWARPRPLGQWPGSTYKPDKLGRARFIRQTRE